MRSAGACLALFVAAASAGCGAHLHRVGDKAASDQAALELRDARLTDGFGPELEQAAKMLEEELAVARAWAQQGRDRDLLDVLAATAADEHDPDAEILVHPRCRGRYQGDGWTTLCSKLVTRLLTIGGFEVPPAPPVVTRPRGKPAAPPATPTVNPVDLKVGELRTLAQRWRGPTSVEAQLARAGTDLGLRARTRGQQPEAASAATTAAVTSTQEFAVSSPRCPARRVTTGDPALADAARRLAQLCGERRAGLEAVRTGAGGQLGAQAERALKIHDALARYDEELGQRVARYDELKWPCISDRGATRPCAPAEARRAFDELAASTAAQGLKDLGYEALGREGRVLQLTIQIEMLDALIEARQTEKNTKKAPEGLAIGEVATQAAELQRTIAGIEQAQAIAVLALIRETLRIERAAVATAAEHAERRRRVELAKLSAQLDEFTLLVEGFARLQRLEAAGCTDKAVVAAQAAEGCRDDATRALQSLSNAWTLGRTAQRQADVYDLAIRHEASIDRSRAAMAVRETYLAAGVAELVKFNDGGFSPEVLALLIVNAVGFGVVAAGVW